MSTAEFEVQPSTRASAPSSWYARRRAQLLVALRSLTRANIILGCAIFVCTLLLAYRINSWVISYLPTNGDEPWYLLFGYSIIHNHTVDLAAIIHHPATYHQFLGVADDHTGDPLHIGMRLLPNLPGYAAFVGLLYAWHGRSGVVLGQAACAALTATLLYVMALRLFGSRLVAVFAALGMLYLAPALLYVGQIFPSTVAALCVFAGLVAVAYWIPAARGRSVFAATAVLAAIALVLPWLHFRYLLASLALVALGAAALYRRFAARKQPRAAVVPAAGLVGVAAANVGLIALYCKHYFGTWTPPINLTRGITLGLFHPDVGRGLALYYDVFLHPQTGLVPWAPVVLLAPIGVAIIWRRDRWTAVCLISLFVALMATLASAFWSDQVYQGVSFPARFAIETLPLLALANSAVFARAVELARRGAAAWMGRWRQTRTGQESAPAATPSVSGRAGRAVLVWGGVIALLCVLLAASSAWFSIVASRDASLLFYSTAGPRLVYKYPGQLPVWWFQAFPAVGQQYWNGPMPTQNIPLPNSAVLAGGAQREDSSLPQSLPPGSYVAHFTFTCAPSSPGSAATTSGTIDVAVLRMGDNGPSQAGNAPPLQLSCHTPGQTQAASVRFTSNGYQDTVFAITRGVTLPITNATVSFASR